MSYKETKSLIKSLPHNISVLLIGNHGIGKSYLVKEIAKEEGIPCIDIRLSQCEPGDLKGFPQVVNGRTYFAPPDFFPMEDEDRIKLEKEIGVSIPPSPKRGILFLDELNRANRDVQQAVFELVYDKSLSGRKMQKGWRVISAINGDDNLYQVNSFDPAFLSRFCVIHFNPTVEEWLEWAENNINMLIVNFIKKYPDLLDPTKEQIERCATNGEKIPDRRSWDLFSQALEDKKEISPEFALGLGKDFVGIEVALKFSDYIKNECMVLTPQDILQNIDNYIDKIKEKDITELGYIVDKLVLYIKREGIDKKGEHNLITFIKNVPDAVVGLFWKEFITKCSDIASKWYQNYPEARDKIIESMSRGVK
jgi:hypothetical protein